MSADSQIVATVRAILADPQVTDVRAALVDLGLLDLLDVEPRQSIRVYFEEQGRTARVTGALDLVFLGETATGLPAPVLYERPFEIHPFGGELSPGKVVHANGVTLEAPPNCSTVLRPFVDAGRLTWQKLRLSSDPTPGDGFTRGLAFNRVGCAAEVTETVHTASPASAARALARARLAIASELLGAAIALRDLAVDHVSNRHQFGAPIGSRQVVRHRLADVEVAIGAARAVLDAIPFDNPLAAIAAKALAGRAAQLACRWALQFCGAMGLTVEHALPAYVRKVQLLDGLFGSAESLTTELGRALLETDLQELVTLSAAPGTDR